jgi:hypothetical protein
MFGSCARVILLGLLAAVSTSAQKINPTDLSGHSIEYDLITVTVQTQVEALAPVVKKLAKSDLTSLFATWAGKFQQAATAGKMTVQANVDNLYAFLSSAAALAPTFAADSKTALQNAPLDFFKFHAFMPAATYDIVEYGIVQSKKSYNATLLGIVRKYMAANADTDKVADLQEIMDGFISVSEKASPGFKKAVWTELDTAYKAVWANNPTRAPTAPPSTATPTPTTTPTPSRSTATNSTSTTAPPSQITTTSTPISTKTAPPTISPDLYIAEPVPVDESKSTTPTPTPSATKKSGALALSATAATAAMTTLVLAAALF